MAWQNRFWILLVTRTLYLMLYLQLLEVIFCFLTYNSVLIRCAKFSIFYFLGAYMR